MATSLSCSQRELESRQYLEKRKVLRQIRAVKRESKYQRLLRGKEEEIEDANRFDEWIKGLEVRMSRIAILAR